MSNQIVVAGEYRVHVAPFGTALPANSVVALDPAFKDCGLTTRDGSSFEDAPEYKRVESHQSQFPTRTFRTKRVGTVMAGLQEWNDSNMVTVFGGGTVTEPVPASGEFRYDPPTNSATEVVSVVLEMVDGTKNYRIVVEQAQAEASTNLPFSPDSETVLPLNLAVIGDESSTTPWYLLTNDPAFNPA